MMEHERYPGEFEAAAREAYLIRQRNLKRGWHANGWRPADSYSRQLDDQMADPIEARALSHLRESQRQAEHDGRTSVSAALRWLAEHPTRNV